MAEFRRGLRAVSPVLAGVLPYALVLGAQAAQKRLSLVEVPLMTGLNFAGGSEFAAIQLWTSPPHIALIVAITFLINSRHLVMSAALAPYLRHLSKKRAFAALFVMCDESWALGYEDARKRERAGLTHAFSLPYYLGTAAGIYGIWVVFTAIGAAIGPSIGDVNPYGFDMAFPAVFLVLLRGMWKGVRAARPWLVSLVVGALTYAFVPGAWYVVAGTLSGIVAAFVWAKQP